LADGVLHLHGDCGSIHVSFRSSLNRRRTRIIPIPRSLCASCVLRDLYRLSRLVKPISQRKVIGIADFFSIF
jgi:hypothetical protein